MWNTEHSLVVPRLHVPGGNFSLALASPRHIYSSLFRRTRCFAETNNNQRWRLLLWLSPPRTLRLITLTLVSHVCSVHQVEVQVP